MDVIFKRVDVADSQSVKDCARRLADAGTEVNVLVNNAGVYPTQGVFSVGEETFEMALEVNTLRHRDTSVVLHGYASMT